MLLTGEQLNSMADSREIQVMITSNDNTIVIIVRHMPNYELQVKSSSIRLAIFQI